MEKQQKHEMGWGGRHFKAITAGVEIWRRVRFQGFLNSLLWGWLQLKWLADQCWWSGGDKNGGAHSDTLHKQCRGWKLQPRSHPLLTATGRFLENKNNKLTNLKRTTFIRISIVWLVSGTIISYFNTITEVCLIKIQPYTNSQARVDNCRLGESLALFSCIK